MFANIVGRRDKLLEKIMLISIIIGMTATFCILIFLRFNYPVTQKEIDEIYSKQAIVSESFENVFSINDTNVYVGEEHITVTINSDKCKLMTIFDLNHTQVSSELRYKRPCDLWYGFVILPIFVGLCTTIFVSICGAIGIVCKCAFEKIHRNKNIKKR